MNEFLDRLPRLGHSKSIIETDAICHPIGAPMSIEMVMERSDSLVARLNRERGAGGVSMEALESAVYHLGEICITGRVTEEYFTEDYKDRRWLSAASSFWASVLSLETNLCFLLPDIEGGDE